MIAKDNRRSQKFAKNLQKLLKIAEDNKRSPKIIEDR